MITFLVTIKSDSANTDISKPMSVRVDNDVVLLVLEYPNRAIQVYRKDLEMILKVTAVECEEQRE